ITSAFALSQDGKIRTTGNEVWVVRRNSALQDRQCSTIQLRGFVVPPAGSDERGQVIECGCQFGVISPVSAFLDRERAPIELFRLGARAAPLPNGSQVVERGSDVDMVLADRALKHANSFAEKRFGLVLFTQPI